MSCSSARHVGTPFEELAEELLGGRFVTPALDQDIQHVPVLINGRPQIVLLPVDFQEDFVQMPLIARLRTSPPEVIGIGLAELPHPLADRLVRYDNAALREQFFNIAKAEAEAKV